MQITINTTACVKRNSETWTVCTQTQPTKCKLGSWTLATFSLFLHKELNFPACDFPEKIETATIAEETLLNSQHHVKLSSYWSGSDAGDSPHYLGAFSSSQDQAFKKKWRSHSGKWLLSCACAAAVFFQKASSPSAMSMIV